MTEEDIRQKWRARSIHEVTFDDGTTYGCILPNLRECLTAGDVPTPILERLSDLVETKGADTTPQDEAEALSGLDAIQALGAFHRRIVMTMVKQIDGEPITLTLDDMAYMPSEHFDRLLAIGKREADWDGGDEGKE